MQVPTVKDGQYMGEVAIEMTMLGAVMGKAMEAETGNLMGRTGEAQRKIMCVVAPQPPQSVTADQQSVFSTEDFVYLTDFVFLVYKGYPVCGKRTVEHSIEVTYM